MSRSKGKENILITNKYQNASIIPGSSSPMSCSFPDLNVAQVFTKLTKHKDSSADITVLS